jgi:glycosyltransferase involved in cell wall biosynthesis
MSDLELAELVRRARATGLHRIESYAWRDLDDPDAGGSEVHADEILSRWARAGLDVHHRTSASPAGEQSVRSGYAVTRRGSRYAVFPRVIARRMLARRRPDVATIEIWNGVPWLSPLWSGGRGVVWLHHLHDDMWRESLPWPLSTLGRTVETRIAPRFYRKVPIMTLAESTAGSLVARGFPSDHVAVVHPGISEVFRRTGQDRTVHPSVVAVGRLAPVKRFNLLIDQFARVVAAHPAATLTIVGTGPLADDLRSQIDGLGLGNSISLAGRVDTAELVDLYGRSWLLASASHSEGWGMTVTEAAACGTPAVVTDNHGHRIAVDDGRTGLVVTDPSRLGEAIIELIRDEELRERMGEQARRRSTTFSWDVAALDALRLLVERLETMASDRHRT